MANVGGDRTVGFIGLGNMGRPMATRLAAAGFSLIVHDVDRAAASELLQSGAKWGDSPRSVAERSAVICTSLPGPAEAEMVYLGDDGILLGVQADSIAIDFTTNSSLLVRKIHQELATRDAALLDAPVSGGVEGAKRGELTILIGGHQELRRQLRNRFSSN